MKRSMCICATISLQTQYNPGHGGATASLYSYSCDFVDIQHDMTGQKVANSKQKRKRSQRQSFSSHSSHTKGSNASSKVESTRRKRSDNKNISASALDNSRLHINALHRLLHRGLLNRSADRLCAKRESTRLLDNRLVNGLRRAADLDDVLEEHIIHKLYNATMRNDLVTQTFSRSIFASAPMRVSRMRLTIHFSPSSLERFRRSDKSLEQKHERSRRENTTSREIRQGKPTQCQSCDVYDSTPR